ncbi:lysozyme g-like isoform X1 [Toxotes jaculatrix]|uniref:lysozyme g-like isoform X1 n=1 Tax=Toxotes jaculatrix TaxID=941984 RepID=UPI001B3B0276|nr:lysozyme g-like isoform X1 [Toxotes jaculatrix]
MSYGDIMRVPTTGASDITAQQDRLGYSGVRASHTMAETDNDRMKKYKSKIRSVGGKYGIDPALIAAIISRESRAGNTLKDGWGDWDPSRNAFNGWGLMQVDVNPKGGGHTPKGGWDSEEHICQGTEILVYFLGRIRNKFRDWSTEQQLKGLFYRISRLVHASAFLSLFSFVFVSAGGIAAYNQGDGNVHSYDQVDAYTTGGDYANDVVARAQWYRNNGF